MLFSCHKTLRNHAERCSRLTNNPVRHWLNSVELCFIVLAQCTQRSPCAPLTPHAANPIKYNFIPPGNRTVESLFFFQPELYTRVLFSIDAENESKELCVGTRQFRRQLADVHLRRHNVLGFPKWDTCRDVAGRVKPSTLWWSAVLSVHTNPIESGFMLFASQHTGSGIRSVLDWRVWAIWWSTHSDTIRHDTESRQQYKRSDDTPTD